MKKFKNMTVGELFKLLHNITKQNADKIKINNDKVNGIVQSKKSFEEKQELKHLLYENNIELSVENTKCLNLNSALLIFYKHLGMYLQNEEEKEFTDLKYHVINEEKTAEKKQLTIHEKQITDHNMKTDTYTRILQSKSKDELLEIMEINIKEEKYEECAVIQRILEDRNKTMIK